MTPEELALLRRLEVEALAELVALERRYGDVLEEILAGPVPSATGWSADPDVELGELRERIAAIKEHPPSSWWRQ